MSTSRIVLLAAWMLAACWPALGKANEPDRSPVDVALSPDEKWLVTANSTSASLSLVAIDRGLVGEQACGAGPSGVAFTRDGSLLLAACREAGTLEAFRFNAGTLAPLGTLRLGFEPRDVVITADGRTAYVSLESAAQVVEVDVERLAERRRIQVGRWPRQMALSPDETRLAVATSGDQSISVVDTAEGALLYQEHVGINIGQLQASADGLQVYLPWMTYRNNPITASNIRKGWVLASRIAKVRLDGPSRREAISLDVPGKAVSDPHGLALSPDEAWIVCTAGGTQELLVYRTDTLRFQAFGGPGDLIERDLERNPEAFYRIDLGGRPLNVAMSRDGQRVFVANYLLNAVQVVDLRSRSVVDTIGLGGPERPSLARRGEAVFFDGRLSLDQWYSCHGCHYEAGPAAVPMDTFNDGSPLTFKTVPSLWNVTQTGPWTWHGWQTDLGDSIHTSLTETMLGPEPRGDEIEALLAYLETLEPPPNPYVSADGKPSAAAQRGREVFHSEQTGCAHCHEGSLLTDGQIHDVGLGGERDAYQGFNTPSLVDVHRKVRLLHDGRAASLEEVLKGDHAPEKVSGGEPLTERQLTDLVEYLKTL